MQIQDVENLIASQIEQCEVRASSPDGIHFEAIVISPVFEGLSPVKRQQMVYACVNRQLADNTIHALSLKTYTPEAWAKLNG